MTKIRASQSRRAANLEGISLPHGGSRGVSFSPEFIFGGEQRTSTVSPPLPVSRAMPSAVGGTGELRIEPDADDFAITGLFAPQLEARPVATG